MRKVFILFSIVMFSMALSTSVQASNVGEIEHDDFHARLIKSCRSELFTMVKEHLAEKNEKTNKHSASLHKLHIAAVITSEYYGMHFVFLDDRVSAFDSDSLLYFTELGMHHPSSGKKVRLTHPPAAMCMLSKDTHEVIASRFPEIALAKDKKKFFDRQLLSNEEQEAMRKILGKLEFTHSLIYSFIYVEDQSVESHWSFLKFSIYEYYLEFK